MAEYLIAYGPDANCTLELCPVTDSVYQYRPSLSASGTFIALFGIFCDIISLVLQASGGAMSSTSSGSSQTGVNIALAGLSFQVFTLLVFIGLALEFGFNWTRGNPKIRRFRSRIDTSNPGRSSPSALDTRFKIFVGFLSLAIILILTRCAYRIDELSDGYSGRLIHNEALFIGLEGM
ncbi:putative parasitic phase-specific protein psp-1 [Phaeomoniella chlamydospora]|uniref:Putative parasitic phase-specific protein psp-1 n=1 Tax=Phaeomoniella chlamydospora TaxID=158046 RepID=A0A0G2GT18_PHACM|nr:putative parasitic phase-specific protein psp-1 [Phaeomoniella chlamydospora]